MPNLLNMQAEKPISHKNSEEQCDRNENVCR